MRCPRCNTPLEAALHEQAGARAEAMGCPGCGGQWFTPRELAAIDEVTDVRLFEIRRIPADEVQQLTVHCPACPGKVPMSKSRSRRDRKVTIDACPECHGIWLDRGELEAIQQEGLLVALKNFFGWLGEA